MRAAFRVINLATLLGAITLLLLSVYPGFVIGCLLLLAYPLIGALGLAWLIATIISLRRHLDSEENVTPLRLRVLLVAPILVIVTYGLLRYYVPRRLAFAACQSRFEAHLDSASVATSRDADGALINQRLGIYRVDRLATDPNGGVYFRTGTGPDGIDTMSYGFAYQPNRKGSPFGAARYIIRPLSGGWYWFQASDDWYASEYYGPPPQTAPAGQP